MRNLSLPKYLSYLSPIGLALALAFSVGCDDKKSSGGGEPPEEVIEELPETEEESTETAEESTEREAPVKGALALNLVGSTIPIQGLDIGFTGKETQVKYAIIPADGDCSATELSGEVDSRGTVWVKLDVGDYKFCYQDHLVKDAPVQEQLFKVVALAPSHSIVLTSPNEPELKMASAGQVMVTATADIANEFCFKTTRSTPTPDDECWKTDNKALVEVSGAQAKIFSWSRNGVGISQVVLDSVPHFSGVVNATSENIAGKHLKIEWQAFEEKPENFHSYQIFYASNGASKGQDWMRPKQTITNYETDSIIVGGLVDGTYICVVVRAYIGEKSDGNTKEICPATKQAITLRSTLEDYFSQLEVYYSGRAFDLALNEVTTIIGKFNGNAKTEELGIARMKQLRLPGDVVQDADGNIYIADDNKVIKVDTEGNFARFAGTGNDNFQAEGNSAEFVSMREVGGLDFHETHGLIIAEVGNNLIRKVSKEGVSTRIVGGGTGGGAGANSDGKTGGQAFLRAPRDIAVIGDNVYVVDSGNDSISRIDLTTSIIHDFDLSNTANPGISVTLTNPSAIAAAIDGESFYIIDIGESNDRILKIRVSDGNALNEYVVDVSPNAFMAHSVNGLYVTNPETSKIQVIDVDNQSVTASLGDGTATTTPDGAVLSSLNAPKGITFDANGDLLVSEYGDKTLRKIRLSDNSLSTLAGFSSSETLPSDAWDVSLNNPNAVAVDTFGNVFVADSENHRILKMDKNNQVTLLGGDGTAAYSGNGVAVSTAQFNRPSDLAFYSDGSLLIADTLNSRVRIVLANDDGVVTKDSLIFDFAGDGIFETQKGDGGDPRDASFQNPRAIAVGPDGSVYINDGQNQGEVVRKVTPDRTKISTFAGTGTWTGASGDYTSASDIGDSNSSGSALSAKFKSIGGLLLDSAGNLYIADTGDNRVRRITTDGKVETYAGNGRAGVKGNDSKGVTRPGMTPDKQGGLNGPMGLAFDAKGNLYITDHFNHMLRMVTADTETELGKIDTLSENAWPGNYTGDGSNISNVMLHTPTGLASDKFGNIYIADSKNNRIRFLRTDPRTFSLGGGE